MGEQTDLARLNLTPDSGSSTSVRWGEEGFETVKEMKTDHVKRSQQPGCFKHIT